MEAPAKARREKGRNRMKKIELVGESYSGKWTRSRTACRGIVLREGKLLLSHEAGSGLWMIPGGGQYSNLTNIILCHYTWHNIIFTLKLICVPLS